MTERRYAELLGRFGGRRHDDPPVPRTLPTCDPRIPAESAVDYGARILRYLIAHEITATLSDDDLALADHAAVYAVQGRYDDVRVYARISAVRHLIAGCQRWRKAALAEPASEPAPVGAPETPNLGPMARLIPVPVQQPPAGQRVHVEF